MCARAVADELSGPFGMLDESITGGGVTIEDGSDFILDDRICLLTTNNHGEVTGMRGGVGLWVSDDGIRLGQEWTQLGFDTIPSYYAAYDPARAARTYGDDPKFERPKVLCMLGHPINKRPA